MSMFECAKDVRGWLDQPPSYNHPNYLRILQGWALVACYESQMHHHPIKDQIHQWFGTQVNPMPIFGLFGSPPKDEWSELLKEAVDRNYPQFMQVLREKLPLMGEDYQKMFDLDQEVYFCDYDIKLRDQIQTELNTVNKLYAFED